MAVTISVKIEAEAFRKSLNDLERRQAPFAIALGLTRTAQDVRQATIARMKRVLDRPTRFTLNAFRVSPATKRNPEASVGFREFTQTSVGFRSYLEPLEFGGKRPPKRFETLLRQKGVMRSDEFAVPARGLKLNRHGNIPASRIVQILSQLQAFNTAGFDANETEDSRKRAGENRARFFAVPSRRRERVGGLAPGIYQRTGAKKRKAKAILIFVRQPTYRAILGFRATARTVTERNLPGNMRAALDHAIATAKLKG